VRFQVEEPMHDDLAIPGNPGWVDTDACDATLILAAIEHGGSVASITLEMYAHDGSPKVETGMELTRDDCRALIERLSAVVG
jgi:hypothetical protein